MIVRMVEMKESCRIIVQALDGLPEGPYITDDRKYALPPRHELATSMEALIHHFKLVTEGFRVPPGEFYYPIESPRGEMGCFVRADGSSKPARVHMRDPSFVNLQALPADGQGPLHRRLHRHARHARPGPRRDRPLMAIDPTRVRRYAHGCRVPGWDDAADLDARRPAVVPDPATTPVPDELRAEIEDYMARYPDFRSAAIPALHAAQRLHGWCSPTAIEQVACVMRLTPGYLTAVATFYDMFETQPKGRVDVYVCTNISCSLRGADALYEAMLDGRRQRPRLPREVVRVPRRVRHRADGVGRRRVRRPARGGRLPADRRGRQGRPPGARGQAAAHTARTRRQVHADDASSSTTTSTSPG